MVTYSFHLEICSGCCLQRTWEHPPSVHLSLQRWLESNCCVAFDWYLECNMVMSASRVCNKKYSICEWSSLFSSYKRFVPRCDCLTHKLVISDKTSELPIAVDLNPPSQNKMIFHQGFFSIITVYAELETAIRSSTVTALVLSQSQQCYFVLQLALVETHGSVRSCVMKSELFSSK